MALHIRNQQQHVRQQQPQHVRHNRNEGIVNNVKSWYEGMMATGGVKHIRSSPKMMLGMIFGFILMVILILVALHYFRLYSFPFLSFIPQKAAPASHLQYFFF